LSESNSLVGSIVDRVVSLKESHAEDEAPRRRVGTVKVTNNQIKFTGNTTNGSVKNTRPDLSVGNEFDFHLIKKDEYDYTVC
jgi:hypothetical protein